MDKFIKRKKTIEVETRYPEIPYWFTSIISLLLIVTLMCDLIIPFLRKVFEVTLILCFLGIVPFTFKNIKEKQQKERKFVKRKEAINMIGSIS